MERVICHFLSKFQKFAIFCKCWQHLWIFKGFFEICCEMISTLRNCTFWTRFFSTRPIFFVKNLSLTYFTDNNMVLSSLFVFWIPPEIYKKIGIFCENNVNGSSKTYTKVAKKSARGDNFFKVPRRRKSAWKSCRNCEGNAEICKNWEKFVEEMRILIPMPFQWLGVAKRLQAALCTALPAPAKLFGHHPPTPKISLFVRFIKWQSGTIQIRVSYLELIATPYPVIPLSTPLSTKMHHINLARSHFIVYGGWGFDTDKIGYDKMEAEKILDIFDRFPSKKAWQNLGSPRKSSKKRDSMS